MHMVDMFTNVCVQFNYDRLRIDKALGNWKSDNNQNNNEKKKSVRSAWGPFPAQKNIKTSHQK